MDATHGLIDGATYWITFDWDLHEDLTGIYTQRFEFVLAKIWGKEILLEVNDQMAKMVA